MNHHFEKFIAMDDLLDSSKEILEQGESLFKNLDLMPENERMECINELRAMLHEYSPLKSEPVDFVRWVPSEIVHANDYNPNKVAPPEMELLAHSIVSDGYTQPIVGWSVEDGFEVIDGFHRNRVGKENDLVRERTKGYLPVVGIKSDRTEKKDRIASTIRHNRARGKHQVDAMSDIVIELKHRNWSNEKIARELGMEEDEVLRLCQITGLAGLFADGDFSEAWDVEGFVTVDDIELADESESRKVPASGEDRIFHTYDKWECYQAGFYNTTMEGMTAEQCKEAYRAFLSDLSRFEEGLKGVTSEWKNSCEHYLTNPSMNRIAWLGQAAMCYATGVPAIYRSGFSLLTEEEQQAANELALTYLNKWLELNGRKAVSMEDAYGGQSDIY